MADITENDVKRLKEELNELVGIQGNSEILESIINLMGMPDEDFVILAPGIMQSFQQSLNNPEEKIVLAQGFNAVGAKAEDLTSTFVEIEEQINNLPLVAAKKDFLKELLLTITNAVSETEGIAKRTIQVPIELCHENAKMPQYAHMTDSGMDVYALDDVTIKPGETILVPTGIKVALPPGYELQVRPKSGRCIKTKMRVANAPGTIDQGYRDEIKVIIDNIEPPIKDITYKFIDGRGEGPNHLEITSIEHGSDYTIGKGEKFCQLVLAEVPKVAWKSVSSVQEIGEDRGGGFGSTGLK